MASPGDRGPARSDGGAGGRSGGQRRDGGAGGRPGASDRRRRGPDAAGPAKWGGVARRGAGRLEREELEDRPERSERTAERTTRPPRPQVERSNRLREEAAEAVSRGQTTKRPARAPRVMDRPPLPPAPLRLPDADVLLRRVLGDKAGGRAVGRLDEAARAFTDERFSDSRRILNQLVERAPQVPEVLELLGLVHYRMGHWRAAAKRMEAFRELTGSTEQHPVLADCYRAQGRWNDVDALWAEVCDASPSAPLVTEGRLVTAGALADQGRLAEAVRLLEKGWKAPSRPRDHHLRRAYALADLYERSGATSRARDLFAWIRGYDGGFADVADRVRSLA